MGLNLKELIAKSNKKHNNKYDYSKCNQTIYKFVKNEIICKKHGSFFKSWEYHINNSSGGCNLCINKRPRRNREQWIDYLNSIHNNQYDYSKVDFTLGVMVKQNVICPKHGKWEVTIDNHSTKKSGCPKCIGRKWKRIDFIREAQKVHGNLYDYSKVDFKNQSIKVEIICKKHGVFKQDLHHHIYQKQGCVKCGREKFSIKKTKCEKDIEKKARKIHYDDYQYDFSNYKNTLSKIKITCKKHGVFIQKVSNHLQGQGCPVCNKSKGELKVRQYLIENNIKFTQQCKFKECKNINPLPFDFYLPKHNTCIEFDGEQHFRPCKRFGGKKAFNTIQKHDLIKNEFCQNNNINLIRIKYTQIKQINKILNEGLYKNK